MIWTTQYGYTYRIIIQFSSGQRRNNFILYLAIQLAPDTYEWKSDCHAYAQNTFNSTIQNAKWPLRYAYLH